MRNLLPEHLSSSVALAESGRLLKAALQATALSDEDAAEAIGFSAKNRSKVYLMREGQLPFTLPKLLMLLAQYPRTGRALLASMAAWSLARTEGFQGSAIALIDDLIRESLDLARFACVARADGKLDEDERRELRRLLTRVRAALDAFDAVLNRSDSEARPS